MFCYCVVSVLFLQMVIGKICCSSFQSDIFEITATQHMKVYWNVPTFQCDYHKLNFTGLAKKYGILQNNNDRFNGEVINILYDPGNFPAILKNGTKTVFRNGGVPQKGDLEMHLQAFKQSVDETIKSDFSGLAVIDFESWRPVFRQNFGTLSLYKNVSIEIERKVHPLWPELLLQKAARRKFEFYARMFMEETLYYGKKLRKKATWGFYAYPYCFNMSPSNMKMNCPPEVVKENDSTYWLFDIVDTFHPSLYLSEDRMTSGEKLQMIEGRINEANRLRASLNLPNTTKLYPYFWYKYQDSKNFLSKDDLRNSLLLLSAMEIDGIVIWGSSNDVNNKNKCYELYDYIDNILGPVIINNF